jgi:hypothetical protein
MCVVRKLHPYIYNQIQLLKPSTKGAKLFIDVTAGADVDDEAAAAAAALSAATNVAAGMTKELIASLPLDEVKKRTILQQQVQDQQIL